MKVVRTITARNFMWRTGAMWKPVTEPPDIEDPFEPLDVLVTDGKNIVNGSARVDPWDEENDEVKFFAHFPVSNEDIKWWMPLPDLPQKEDIIMAQMEKQLTFEDAKACPLCGSKKRLHITSKNQYYELLGLNGGACISIECRGCHLELYNHEDHVRRYETKVHRLITKWNTLHAE